jgi:chromosome segregation ATPase
MKGEYHYFLRATAKWRKAVNLLAGEVHSLRRRPAELRAEVEAALNGFRRDLDQAHTTFSQLWADVAQSAQIALSAEAKVAALQWERSDARERAELAEKRVANHDATWKSYEDHRLELERTVEGKSKRSQDDGHFDLPHATSDSQGFLLVAGG